MEIIKSAPLLVVLALVGLGVLGAFGYLALTDVPVHTVTVTKTLSNEQFFDEK